MKSEPLISIIVPVYKVEEYLPACIESILSQSFKDFELILVINGSSPDRCSSLCAEYEAQDMRIVSILITDVGVSKARNAGLQAARGRYLLFIDGDDFIAKDSLSNLYEALTKDDKADVVFLNAAYCFPDGQIHHFDNIFDKSKLYIKSKKEALAFISSLSDLNTSVCLKLIRREVISSNNISFTENITFAEDTDFCLKLFLYAQAFSYCGSYVYFYRKGRKGSATYICFWSGTREMEVKVNLELRLFIIAISILVFLFIIRMLVKKNLSETDSVMWFIIGLITFVSGLFPDIIARLSLLVGIAYPPALLFLLSIVMLLIIALKNTINLSKTNTKINEISSILSILVEENRKLKSIISELTDTDTSLTSNGIQESIYKNFEE